jgi:hypothetical protein
MSAQGGNMRENFTTTIQEAKDCLGNNRVFGPDEWLKYFPQGISFSDAQLARIAEVPWPKSVLVEPSTLSEGKLKEHFLFLGVDQIGTEALHQNLNLHTWIGLCHEGILPGLDRLASRVCRSSNGPKFNDPRTLRDWYLKDWQAPRSIGTPRVHYTNLTCEFRWYFMPVDALGSSVGAREVHRPCEYELAKAIEVVTANALYYLLNHEYMRMVQQVARSNDYSVLYYGQSVCVWSGREGLVVGTLPAGSYPGAVLLRSSDGY